MELYLDSVNNAEITEAFDLGFVHGLTTTPTFMHRHGITDIDGAIEQLSRITPNLHVEALGETTEAIIHEAYRLLNLDLAQPPIFKIPASNHGLKASNLLLREGLQTNIHLVYTLNQAYMAMAAGATYVCPLVGRMHDEGQDAMRLIEQAVNCVSKYNYPSKIMVSSVRHAEHVRLALTLGAHACTMPWSVMKNLSKNNFTEVGVKQFYDHTRLITVSVREVIRPEKPVCYATDTVLIALVQMTHSKLGAVCVIDEKEQLAGIFTDGDLRRSLKEQGETIVNEPIAKVMHTHPFTINANALLQEAVALFRKHGVDNFIVLDNELPIGILDIQDLIKLGLIG